MPHYFVIPTEEYAKRLREREARLAECNVLHARLGSLRLLIGGSFLVVGWLCFGPAALPIAWLLLPAAAFAAAVLFHGRIRTRRSRVERAAQFYRLGLARLRGEWTNDGQLGEHVDVRHHIYGGDLDLFGKGGLYQLLCAAQTQMGQSTLARWLLTPAAISVIDERRLAVADLRNRLDFRERMNVDGEPVRLGPESLRTWAQTANRLQGAWIRLTGPLLASLAVAAAVVWGWWSIRSPLLVILLLEVIVAYALRQRIQAAIAGIEGAYEDLKTLTTLLQHIETEPFDAKPLRAVALGLASQGLSASQTLSKLTTIVNLVESRRNPILTPLLLVLMYPLQAAVAAERWRCEHGMAVIAWLDVLGEIEALMSMARFDYEHPDNTVPEFVEGPAQFHATALGHPLLPAAVRICNDVDIAAPTRVLLVSGSNMSGKSTLLRSVGINTVLAMAGASVCAERMRLTPVQIGASIRTADSLQEGSSRFYAEITRLRQLVEASGMPLLFLLDELLQGTNSADRRVGAEGIMRALISQGGIGLISTHDLELTHIGGPEGRLMKNVHFQDELQHGKLTFDFKLQPGVVTKSNGIELMRSIGLDV